MKIFKITAFILGILLLTLLILPFVFRGKITQLVKEEINNNVNAQVDFGTIGLSLLRSFPDFSLRIKDLSVIGKTPFEGDTLFYSQYFDLQLDIWSVFRGSPYEIKNIRLENPVLHLIVLKDGSVNWDIAPESSEETAVETTASSAFTIAMNAIEVKNARVAYDDLELDFLLKMNELKGILKGDLSMDVTKLHTDMEIASISMTYEGMTLLSDVSGKTSANILADLGNDSYTISTEQLSLNALELSFEGTFNLTDTTIGMNFDVLAPNGNFAELLSIVPPAYLNDSQNISAEGDFKLSANMNGVYADDSFPGFGLDLTVDKGRIAHPDMPDKIEKLSLELSIKNETGDMEQTTIRLQPLRFSVKDNPFEMRLNLNPPMSNPLIDLKAQGKVLLESITALIPDETMAHMQGQLDLQLMLKSRLDAIQNEQYANIEAEGNAVLTNFKSPVSGLQEPLLLEKAAAGFSPKEIQAKVENMKVGKSDFNFSGKIQHYLSYIAGDGVLLADLDLRSKSMDANELMQLFAQDSVVSDQADTTAFTLDLPERIAFQFSASMDQLLYENYDLRNIQAKVSYADKIIRFSPLKASLFGGELRMAGMLDGIDPVAPLVNLDFTIDKFDIPLAYSGIGLFQAAAPVASKTTGSFSTQFNFKGKLDENLQPVFSSLQGGGGLSTSKIKIESVESMNMLASLLGNDDYKRLITDGIQMNFEFINGRVYQKPFSLKYADSDITMSGSIGFDQTLNYDLLLMVPYEKLGNKVTSALTKLVEETGKQGVKLQPGTTIQVKATITGTATSPKVSIDYKDFANNIKTDLKNLALEELEKQKQALKAQVQAEAAKILAEAQKQADQLIAQANATAASIRTEASKAAQKLRDEGNKQADKLIAEGKSKGLIAEKLAVEAAKKVRQQADKSAIELENQADQQASNVQQQARLKADSILQEAERKASAL